MKRWVLGLATGLLTVGLAWTYHENALSALQEYLNPDPEDPIPTLELIERKYRLLVLTEGELIGLKTTPVLTPEVRRGGLKIAWMREEGALVEPGEVLVRFDSSEAQLALEENQNQVSTLRQQIDKTATDSGTEMRILEVDRKSADLEFLFARSQIRRDDDIFSRWEIQESLMSAALAEYKQLSVDERASLRGQLTEADLGILEIEKKQANTEVELAEEALSALELPGSVGGVLFYKRYGWKEVEVGSEAWPGQELMEIADLNQFRARLEIPESDISGVRSGSSVQVTVNALPEKSFTGRVATLAATSRQISRKDPRKYFECQVDLNVSTEILSFLKPGMRVQGQIATEVNEHALVLPRSAVFREEEQFVVFTQEETSYKRNEVEILGGDHGFYVVEGLEEGQLACLKHPFDRSRLRLPDFNAPSTSSVERRFTIIMN